MAGLKRKGRIFLAILLIMAAAFTEADAQKVSAKIGNCYIEGAGEYGGRYSWYFTKIKFNGNKVMLKGKFQAKVNGKKKIVKKLTIPVASNCKFFDGEDDGLKKAKKSTKVKKYQKLNFIWLTLTIKNGKAVRFVDGA